MDIQLSLRSPKPLLSNLCVALIIRTLSWTCCSLAFHLFLVLAHKLQSLVHYKTWQALVLLRRSAETLPLRRLIVRCRALATTGRAVSRGVPRRIFLFPVTGTEGFDVGKFRIKGVVFKLPRKRKVSQKRSWIDRAAAAA